MLPRVTQITQECITLVAIISWHRAIKGEVLRESFLIVAGASGRQRVWTTVKVSTQRGMLTVSILIWRRTP
jgi:hypothetical protein